MWSDGFVICVCTCLSLIQKVLEHFPYLKDSSRISPLKANREQCQDRLPPWMSVASSRTVMQIKSGSRCSFVSNYPRSALRLWDLSLRVISLAFGNISLALENTRLVFQNGRSSQQRMWVSVDPHPYWHIILSCVVVVWLMILRTFSCAYRSCGYALLWSTYLSFLPIFKLVYLQYFESEFFLAGTWVANISFGLWLILSLNGIPWSTEVLYFNTVQFTNLSFILNAFYVLFRISLQTMI